MSQITRDDERLKSAQEELIAAIKRTESLSRLPDNDPDVIKAEARKKLATQSVVNALNGHSHLSTLHYYSADKFGEITAHELK